MQVISVGLAAATAIVASISVTQLVRGQRESSAGRLRQLSTRARVLAAVACFLGLLAPVVSVTHAFTTVASVLPEDRAKVLAGGISAAMDDALWIELLVAPTVIIAFLLAKRSRAAAKTGSG